MAVGNRTVSVKSKHPAGEAVAGRGNVPGKGLSYLERWWRKRGIEFWRPISEKEAYTFYRTLPAVKASPPLQTVAEFRKWNSRRIRILETAEADFKQMKGIPVPDELSASQKRRLDAFIRQRVARLNAGP
jgi:hypothetical protein